MHQEKRGLQLRNSADSAAPVPFPPMQQKTAPTSIVRPGDEKHWRSEMRERQQGAAPIYCKKRERGKNEAPLPKECFGLFLRCRMDDCRIPHPTYFFPFTLAQMRVIFRGQWHDPGGSAHLQAHMRSFPYAPWMNRVTLG